MKTKSKIKEKIKTPADSETIMTEVVFSHDTNPVGIVQGGRIIQLMDIACAIWGQLNFLGTLWSKQITFQV